MNINVYSFICLVLFLSSCQDNPNEQIEDLAAYNEEGDLETKVESLSVEDVERLMNSSENPSESYTGIVNNETDRIYYVEAEPNQKLTCRLDKKSPNVQLKLYKEAMISVKKDSNTYVRIKDYELISKGDSSSNSSKNAMKYKLVVGLSQKFDDNDETSEFTIKVFKDSI